MTEQSADKISRQQSTDQILVTERMNSGKTLGNEDQKKDKEFDSPIKPTNLPKKKPQHNVGIGSSMAAARDRDQVKGIPMRKLADGEMALFAMLGVTPADDSKQGNSSGDGTGTKNKDGGMSEVDSTVMGAEMFNANNMSQPIQYNDEDSLGSRGVASQSRTRRRIVKKQPQYDDFIYEPIGQNGGAAASQKGQGNAAKSVKSQRTVNQKTKQAKTNNSVKGSNKQNKSANGSNNSASKISVAADQNLQSVQMDFPIGTDQVLPPFAPLVFDQNVLYCICRQPESIEMIGCDTCEDWYHASCVGIDFAQVLQAGDAGFPFMCDLCKNKADSKSKKSKSLKKQENAKKPLAKELEQEKLATESVQKSQVSKNQKGKSASVSNTNQAGIKKPIKKVEKQEEQKQFPETSINNSSADFSMEDVDLTAKETLVLKKKGKSCTYPTSPYKLPIHSPKNEKNALQYQRSEVYAMQTKMDEPIALELADNKNQIQHAQVSSQQDYKSLEANETLKLSSKKQNSPQIVQNVHKSNDMDYEIKVNPIKTTITDQIVRKNSSHQYTSTGIIAKTSNIPNQQQISEIYNGMKLGGTELPSRQQNFTFGGKSGNEHNQMVPQLQQSPTSSGMSQGGEKHYSHVKNLNNDSKQGFIESRGIKNIYRDAGLTPENTPSHKLIGMKRKLERSESDLQHRQPLVKRAKILNEGEVPQVGLYDDHSHNPVFKWPLITREASITKQTELADVQTLVKHLTQSGSSTKGEDSSAGPKSINDIFYALKSRFQQNMVPRMHINQH